MRGITQQQVGLEEQTLRGYTQRPPLRRSSVCGRHADFLVEISHLLFNAMKTHAVVCGRREEILAAPLGCQGCQQSEGEHLQFLKGFVHMIRARVGGGFFVRPKTQPRRAQDAIASIRG